MPQITLGARIEAVLFAAGEPIPKKRLAALLGEQPIAVQNALDDLRQSLAGHGVALVETGDEAELRSAPSAADAVQKLREGELSKDLGRAGLEALAVILYRGGATRGEIDWIRGVNSAAIVRSLLLRGLVEREGDPSDRRRFRYTATTDALGHIGIGSMKELPRFDELQLQVAQAAEDATRAETEEAL